MIRCLLGKVEGNEFISSEGEVIKIDNQVVLNNLRDRMNFSPYTLIYIRLDGDKITDVVPKMNQGDKNLVKNC